jgi:hypothetical protein
MFVELDDLHLVFDFSLLPGHRTVSRFACTWIINLDQLSFVDSPMFLLQPAFIEEPCLALEPNAAFDEIHVGQGHDPWIFIDCLENDRQSQFTKFPRYQSCWTKHDQKSLIPLSTSYSIPVTTSLLFQLSHRIITFSQLDFLISFHLWRIPIFHLTFQSSPSQSGIASLSNHFHPSCLLYSTLMLFHGFSLISTGEHSSCWSDESSLPLPLTLLFSDSPPKSHPVRADSESHEY